MTPLERKNLNIAISEFYKILWKKASATHTSISKGLDTQKAKAKNRRHLIRRIKDCFKNMDLSVIIKMLDHFEPKIHLSNERGLSAMIK